MGLALNKKMQHLIKKFLRKYLFRHAKISYSHLGEDCITDHLFKNISDGTYVDVGANDPIVYSNTYKLYLEGWSGVCVEPNILFKKRFGKYRPKDAFENYAINSSPGTIRFRINDDHRTSHVIDDDKDFSQNDIQVECKTISSILASHQVKKDFELLNIDIEGHELIALESLDFNQYSPQYILIEIHNFDFNNIHDNEVFRLLVSKGYSLIAHTLITAFFKKI